MFDAIYFKNLINETTELISNKQNVSKEDLEEIEARIESNKLTLKLIAEEIEDKDLRLKTIERIDSLYGSFDDIEVIVNHRKDKLQDNKTTERVEEDILKYSFLLKNKAKRLLDGLDFDKKILDEVTEKMTKNIAGTSDNIKKISLKQTKISLFNLFIFSVVVFLFMYFVIRFM